MSDDNKKKRFFFGIFSSKIQAIVLILVFFAGAIGFAGFNSILAYTNTMEFCVSCHSMTVNLEEYKETAHYKNASGVQANCADCHVPRPWVYKVIRKIQASKEVYGKVTGLIDTKEKFEAHRWEMANRVWDQMKATDSRECRNCHDFANMDLDEQDRSGRKKHSRAIDKGQTCIDCHKGIAHEYPEEPEETEPTE